MCIKNNNHNNSRDNTDTDNIITVITIRSKKKRRPKIMTEIKQINLKTNDYDPTPFPSLIPRYPF